MTTRRDLLKITGAAAFSWAPRAAVTHTPAAALREGRRLVRAGSLGQVVLCRVSGPNLFAAVEFVLGERVRITEVSAITEGAVFLGTRATLEVSSRGCRLFTRDEAAARCSNGVSLAS